MSDFLLGALVAIAFACWVVLVGAALADARKPPRVGRGPKWGSFGPL